MRFFSHKTIYNLIKTLFKAIKPKLWFFVGVKKLTFPNSIGTLSVYYKLALLLVVFLTGYYVYAQSITSDRYTIETVNVFPDTVITQGWKNVRQISIQNLSDTSLYQEFNKMNSAYIDIDAYRDRLKSKRELSPIILGHQTVTSSKMSEKNPVLENNSSTSLEINTSPAKIETQVFEQTDLPDITANVEALSVETQDIEEAPLALPTSTEELVATTTAFKKVSSFFNYVLTSAQDILSFDQEEATNTYPSVDSIIFSQQFDSKGNQSNSILLSESISIGSVLSENSKGVDGNSTIVEDNFNTETATSSVLATTTISELATKEASSSTEIQTTAVKLATSTDIVATTTEISETESTTTKNVINKISKICSTCEPYVITMDGFGLDIFNQSLQIGGGQLRVSFAGKRKSSRDAMEEIRMNYSFDDGKTWQEGGVININDEASNSINGGYYLFSIPELEKPADLEKLKVELVYKGDPLALEGIYIESAWLELFTVRAPKISEVDISTLLGGDGFNDSPLSGDQLITPDKNITFNNTDDNTGETLIIKSNESTYSGLTNSTTYFSVSNTGSKEDTFKLKTYFPSGTGKVISLEQWNRNKPKKEVIPEYRSFSYYCDAGWEAVNQPSVNSLQEMSRLLFPLSQNLGNITNPQSDTQTIQSVPSVKVVTDSQQISGITQTENSATSTDNESSSSVDYVPVNTDLIQNIQNVNQSKIPSSSAQAGINKVLVPISEPVSIDELQSTTSTPTTTAFRILQNAMPFAQAILESSSTAVKKQILITATTISNTENTAGIQDPEFENNYICRNTSVVRTCDTTEGDNTSCVKQNIKVREHNVVRYAGGWQKDIMEEGEDTTKKSFFKRVGDFLGFGPKLKKIPEYFETRSHSADSYNIKPGETKYFKMDIAFPVLSNGEFYIEAIGNKEYGLLDPFWSSQWKYRVPVTLDNTAGNENLTEQQVLLKLTSTGLTNFWSNVNSDGSDVRFVAEVAGNENGTWYDTSWSKRTPVTVQASQVSATLTDYPIYLDLSDLGTDFFSNVQTTGADIRITSGDGVTEVPYEMVSIDTTLKTGELYFKALTVSSATNTTFYIYYGNAGVLGYGVTDTYGGQNVWTNNYAAVWHMNDASATTIEDSTSGGYTGTKGTTSQAPVEISSPLGKAQFCDGGDYVEFGDVLNVGLSDWTVSTWYEPTVVGSGNNSILYNKENLYEAAAGGNAHTFAWRPFWSWTGGSSFTTSINNWYYSATTYDHSNQRLYKNGIQVFSRAQTGDIGTNAEQLQFCARGNTNHTSLFTGNIDEIRMSSVARSVDWTASTYTNQNTPNTFYATSSVESLQPTQYTELDFWLQYFNTTTSEADIWVQVDSLPAATTTTIYMYYGNTGVVSASDELNTFTYSALTDTYYVVENVSTANLNVYSLINNNTVQLDNGAQIALNKGEVTTLSGYASTSVIRTLGPISVTIDGIGGDTIVPISFASTTLAAATNRGISNYYLYSPFASSSVQTYIGSSATPDESFSMATGTATTSNTDAAGSNGVIIESSEPILAYHKAGNNDSFVMYPPTIEDLFGIDSNNTQVTTLTSNPDPTVDCSSGVSAVFSNILRGENQLVNTCTQGSEGAGNAVRFSGALYPLAAIQQADSDGNESTVFLPQKEFSTEYYLPTSAAYVAIACSPRFGTTTLEVQTNSGTVIESATCAPSGNSPGKAYFANGGNGDTLAFNAGYKVVSTNGVPFYAIYEDQVDNDETNVWGSVQARKFLKTPVTTTFGTQELTIDAQYEQLSFGWYQNINNQTPTTTWSLGEGTFIAEGDNITGQGAVNVNDVLRLRMNLQANVATGTATSSAFKLQYTASDTCTLSTNIWLSVGETGSTTAAFSGYNNSAISDGSTLASTTLASSTVFATYEEENLSSKNPNAINVGAVAEWDWVLQSKNTTVNTNYCFRMVRSGGQKLITYTSYPELFTAGPPLQPTSLIYFDNEHTAVLNSVLEFTATDAAGDDIDYQVQIDNNLDFFSPAVDRNSGSNFLEFENLNTPSDKVPFASGARIRFTSPTTLTASTTYWWRVRGKDPAGSNTYGDWSIPKSFTTDGSVVESEWYQTTGNQFTTDTLSGLSTSTTAVALASSPATLITTAIDFDDGTVGNAWGSISWNDTETSGIIVYQVEYLNGSSWTLVPDTEIANNSIGIGASPINILGLDTNTYNQIRIVATFTGTTLSLQDLAVTWGQKVNTPSLGDPFDNEEIANTTPTFTFLTTDPQSDDIEYEISYGADYSFAASTTINSSSTPANFSDITTPADTTPFASGDTISYTIPSGSALTNNTTYWWRVRAKDPNGANSWSSWSDADALTVNTGVSVSTWFQTTKDQFDQGTYNGLKASTSDSVVVNDIVGEYGRATTTDNTWLTINTQNTYSNMVVTGSARYTGNPQPERTVRVRNKTINSFEIKVDDYTAAFAGGNTVVDYMVMEAGDWTMLDGGTGTRIIAGTVSNVSVVKARTYATTGNIPVSFVPAFSAPPTVLATVSTDNDISWVFTSTDDAVNRVNEPTASQAGFALARGFESAVHNPEDIDYIAMDIATGTNNGTKFDFMRTADAVGGVATAISYNNTTFINPPGVNVLNNIGEDGGDGGFAFIETATPGTATQFYPEIGEGGVGANGHTNEIISAVVFEADSGSLLRDNTTVSLSGTVASEPIFFSDGSGPKFERFLFNQTSFGNSTTSIQVQYLTSTSSWALVPDSQIPGNGIGTTTSPVDLRNLDVNTYGTIRLFGTLTCDGSNCPELHDWTVEWSQGVTLSGTAKAYDRSTNVTSGTVAVAVNGVRQIGKTGTISAGVWTINNVTAFTGDVVTVWVDGANDPNEAISVFVYDGVGDMTNVDLYEQHLTVSSDETATTTDALLGSYDNSVSGDEDIFFDVNNVTNDLSVCAITGCSTANLYVGVGNVFVPATSTVEVITTNDLVNDGKIELDGNTVKVGGSWENNGNVSVDTSSVIMTASMGTEKITDVSHILVFNNLTFGETSGTAIWQADDLYDINGNLTVSFGTLDRASSSITVAGNLSTGANGYWSGIASTTFDGNGAHSWSDANAISQNIGHVVINGSAQTITMSSDVRAQSVQINSGNTLNAGGANSLYVSGDFTNNSIFTAQTGSLIIEGSGTNAVVSTGVSSLYNITASTTNNGALSFNQSNLTVLGNFSIATGTVTMPTATTTVIGSFLNTGGVFVHNNGEVRFAGSGVQTIEQQGTVFFNAFYDVTFTGSGAWSFVDTNATTSNNFKIQSGTVTLPAGQLTVGGLYSTTGSGAFAHNNGEVLLLINDGNTVLTNGSNFNDVRVKTGTGSGVWYNNNWGYRKAITISASAIDATLTDYPVYVDVSDFDATFFTNVKTDGADIRMTTSDGVTETPFELVSIDTVVKTGELYFKAPTISSSINTTFYLYYGNIGATGYATTDTYGAQNVWTNGYAGVWHMNDVGSTIIDSTSGGYTGTKGGGATAPTEVVSPYGKAQSFDGGDYIDFGDVLDPGANNWTVGVWYKPTVVGASTQGILYNKETLYEAGAGGNEYRYAWQPFWNWGNGGYFTTSINNWYQGVTTYDHINQEVFKDGMSVYSRAQTGNMGSNGSRLQFGARGDTGHTTFFTGEIDEVRMSSVARSAQWLNSAYINRATTTDFYSVSTAESSFVRTFSDTNTTILGNMVIESGEAVFPTGVLSVGGSFTNNGVFNANGGTVAFDSTAGAETIAPGNSSFATLKFDSSTGDFTITENATSTTATQLLNANAFTLNSGLTLESTGTFGNAVGGASTTWTGSTLKLSSNTDYPINTKLSSGDVYDTIVTTGDTDVSMWNSSAVTYTTQSVSSIYSQDHAANNGDLYIFGDYARENGTEYWSYATDFDGADLTGGGERQVDVRPASGAVITASSSVLLIVGSSTASTTINSQSGTFTLLTQTATVTASYFEVSGTDVDGFNITGSTTVTSFDNALFTIGAGVSAVTVDASTIDTNPASQFFNTNFVTGGGSANVTLSGVPTSYWWFRNGTGDRYGEAFDNGDGDPGALRWDDSSYIITISGVVYADDGVTPLGGPTCDGVTNAVRVVVDGGTYTNIVPCSGVDGSYTLNNVAYIGDPSIIVYLDTNGGVDGSVITKTPTASITNLDIYAHRVITRHEDIAALTIADMAVYDNTDDGDIPFTAATGTIDILTVLPDTELHIWATSTFTPGGVVTLNSGGTLNTYDGSLHIDNAATFTGVATTTYSVGGIFAVDSGATFVSASSTVLMTATTSGKAINTENGETIAFNELQFTGVGGSWNINGNISSAADIEVATGTVTGTGNVTLFDGSFFGPGLVSLGGGTTTLEHTNTLGGSQAWTFNDLTLGNGLVVGTTTPGGSATTTVLGMLTIDTAHFLDAGNSLWDLRGTGNVFVENGTFLQDTSTLRYSGNAATNILSTEYYNLDLNANSGSPTYTATGLGITIGNNLTVGGAGITTVTFDTNDPALDVNGNVLIRNNGTLIASNSGLFTVAGDWDTNGTFAGSGGTVTFDGAATTAIASGNSSFSSVVIDGTGTFTVSEHATATSAFTLTNAGAFTLGSGQILAVGGIFTNGVAGAATTWTGSELSLYGGGNYEINASTTVDQYSILFVAQNTDIRMWNSDATTISVNSTGSLYSMNHNNISGDLYVYGNYPGNGSTDYWSYATDFDGTDLTGGNERKVDVFFAAGSSAVVTGGGLHVLGDMSASTTLQNQGSGTYSLRVGGNASTTWSYYEIRNIDTNGLTFSGTPTVTTLTSGDSIIGVAGGSGMTVGGTVIDANPAKTFTQNIFATTTVLASAFNVTATGTSVSSWRFTNHVGNLSGEDFDVDPGGDPGYVVWDDSSANITISGNVYSDEGSTVSTVCDSATNNITLVVAGLTSFTTNCNGDGLGGGTGAYSIAGVSYSPNDTLTLYIGGETQKAANITIDPISSIGNMDLYENRVIVRHESTDPITIADMSVWDSSDDTDVPFTAINSSVDTLTLPSNRKLLIWNGKEFAPNGNVTLSGGGAGAAYDGTIELQDSASFTAANGESHSVGGSFLMGTGATFDAQQSTTTFTTTGASRTIDTNEQHFYNMVFNGSGSWAIANTDLDVLSDVTITSGAVTLPTGSTTISGSFDTTGGSFNNSGGTITFDSVDTGETIEVGGSDFNTVLFDGSGTWAFQDANATTTASFTVADGIVTLPSGVLTVGDIMTVTATGTITHNSGTLRLTTSTTSTTLLLSGSDLSSLVYDGSGSIIMSDDSVALLGDLSIESGSVTFASTTLSIGGSLNNNGTFIAGSSTVLFNSSDIGETVDVGGSDFYNVSFSAAGGGWTFLSSATSTNNLSLTSATNFIVGAHTLSVFGVFTNTVGGSATNWDTSTLRIESTAGYTINTKVAGGDKYNILSLVDDLDIRMWDSEATTTILGATSTLYSQDHAGNDGDLYIYGEYQRVVGSDYWSYATDFDGAALSGGARRVVDVFMIDAATSSVTLSGGSLEILGEAGSTTTIQALISDTYSFDVSGGTFNAQYYAFRDLDTNGLEFTNSPILTSLSNGDFEASVNLGSLITLASSTLNANASKVISNVRFATTTPIAATNVKLIGTTVNAWRFSVHTGNISGENYDTDGADACGSIRWDDSSCLLTEQTHYRWRNDDGGEGVPDSEWYDTNWTYRKQVRVVNDDATTYTNLPVFMNVIHDADMQSDFEDLRFTDENGDIIPYWIERFTASTNADVWVNVPTTTASAVTSVFMYYGNALATSTASGTAVFPDMFDDFEDGNVSEYSGDTTLFNVDASFAYDGINGLEGSPVTAKTTNGMYRTDVTASQGEILRYLQYVDTSAGSGDESCTFFGVQGASQNYALCFELFGTDRISLVRDAEFNETSGIFLASSSITYVTGWHEVEIDWQTDNTIAVTVLKDNVVVATTSATDGTYTSGGIGFGFWFQNGGWDTYTSRPRTDSDPTVYFGVETVNGGATWLADIDTLTNSVALNETARVRFAVENTGLDIVNQNFQLEFAEKGASPSCESVSTSNYVTVPVQASCSGSAICMQTSANFVDSAPTTDLLSGIDNTYTYGQIVEDPSTQTGNINLVSNEYTEIEYAITATNDAIDSNYCLRVTDGGTEYDSYLSIAEMELRFDPTISTLSLNGGVDISLLPGATTTIYATGTASDLNGYADLTLATSTIFRSGVSESCSADDNNCYISATPQCSFTNCSGNSCTVECTADIYYYADPTDAGTYAGQTWRALLEVSDAGGNIATATAPSIDLMTLRAIDVDNTIGYGSLAPLSDTGSINASTTIENIGNDPVDISIEGTDLTDGGSSLIPASEQIFATSTFTYSTCVICSTLATTSSNYKVDLNKPASTTPAITDEIYWGIKIPFGVSGVAHQGTITFYPIGNQGS